MRHVLITPGVILLLTTMLFASDTTSRTLSIRGIATVAGPWRVLAGHCDTDTEETACRSEKHPERGNL